MLIGYARISTESHLKDNESKKKFQNNMFLNFLKEFNKDLYKQLER